MQILKNMAFKTRLPSLPVHQRWRIRHNDFKTFPYIQFLGKAAKFDGHSLNGFEVIHLSERGEVKCPPGQNRVKIRWRISLKYFHGFLIPRHSFMGVRLINCRPRNRGTCGTAEPTEPKEMTVFITTTLNWLTW